MNLTKAKSRPLGFRRFGFGFGVSYDPDEYPFNSRLHPLSFQAAAVFVIVNAITSTPKSQWTLADSVSERTVSMDSHSF